MSVNVTIVKHALVEHKLTILRNKNTNRKDFKTTVTELTYLLISEASKNFDLKEINITTPLEKTTGKTLGLPHLSHTVSFLLVSIHQVFPSR